MSEDADAIRATIGDLCALRQRVNVAAMNMTAAINRMHEVLARREATRRVSDHALVRYLERVHGIDMDKARAEIRRMCDESVPFSKCEGLWHAKGMVFITSDDGAVVTVLGEGQVSTYIGRKLMNGQRSALEVPEEPMHEVTAQTTAESNLAS